MGEINHDFWDELFEHQKYENIDQDTLLHLIKCIENMKNDVLAIQQEFEEVYNLSFQNVIEQKKPKEDMSEEIQRNVACTSTVIQQYTKDDAKSKENIELLEQLKEEITEKLEKIDLTKQRMTDNMPSKIDDEKNELMKDNKYLQFVEIMHWDEIREVFAQIIKLHEKKYLFTEDKLRKIPTLIEFFTHRINLMNKFVELKGELLKLKLERERMTTKVKAVGVEMTNMSCKMDHEKRKLMIDNKYLRFVETIRQKEINRIFVHLQTYRDIYNMPNEEVKIATHKDFIMQRIEVMKEMLKLKAVDFALQIERKAINMETNDAKTFNMSSKDDKKSTLMKNNKCLRYIAMKHQEEINRVYAQLQMFCDEYNMAIEKKDIVVHPNVRADDVEKTSMPSEIEKDELKKNNEYLRSIRAKYQKEFIEIYDELKMCRDRYDMPNENVTIVMHMKPYDPMKTRDEENDLMRDNEYLAFVAMMHLEKIKEICLFFEMYRNRFNKSIEDVIMKKDFMKQKLFVTDGISCIKNFCFCLLRNLEVIKRYEGCIINKYIRHIEF